VTPQVRLEQVLGQVWSEERPQDSLRLGAEADHPSVRVVTGLVGRRAELPDAAAAVDFACSKREDLTSAGTAEPLKLHHCPYWRGQVRERQLHHLIGHGLDRRRLAGADAALWMPFTV
jgi:hypothetical protein